MMKNKPQERVAASFRDPSGFVFQKEGEIYRQINLSYQADYDLLLSSGLYQELVKHKMLLAHEEVQVSPALPELHYKTIKPQQVRFISYPYEWSFSQYRDAAIQTLRIQKMALQYGMILKDASAYNIQFVENHPVLIDTLSFTGYKEGRPWVAYRQYCQHFLAPLALMSKVDVHLSKLLLAYIDGLPLDIAGKLLPFSSRINFGLATHIHLHAAALKKYTSYEPAAPPNNKSFSKTALTGLVDSLANTVRSLKWQAKGENWAAYYTATNYSDQAFSQKQVIISDLLHQIQPKTVWDLGANTGVFSKAVQDLQDCLVISSDYDPGAVELNYLDCKKNKIANVHPLILDLVNPTPAIGWANEERLSFLQRGPVDVVMALALIHHLAISNNLPLEKICGSLAAMGKNLIIEFVPKQDSQVKRLLSPRDDIFPEYQQQGFLQAFEQAFTLQKQIPVPGTERIIFWFIRKEAA
jgi:ribosomal protein L11 methylase PrmA